MKTFSNKKIIFKKQREGKGGQGGLARSLKCIDFASSILLFMEVPVEGNMSMLGEDLCNMHGLVPFHLSFTILWNHFPHMTFLLTSIVISL